MPIDCEVAVVDIAARAIRRVHITGDEDEPVAVLAERLRRVVAVDGEVFLEGRPLPRSGTIGSLGLTQGATVSIGRSVPGPRVAQPSGMRLNIVGGRDVGASFELQPGRAVIGRADSADVCLADPEVSRGHAELSVSPDGRASISDTKSANGTIVEGTAISGPTPLRPGDVVQVGSTLLAIEPTDVEALKLEPGDGYLGVHRRFRPAPGTWPAQIDFPQKRDDGEPPSIHLLLTILPGLAMAAMAVLTHRLEFLLFSAIAPLIGVARAVSQRRAWDRRAANALKDHRQELADATVKLRDAVHKERTARRLASPHLGQLAQHARLPGRRLWERQPADDDFLLVRLGMVAQPSTIDVRGGPTVPSIWRLPINVGLRTARNLSIVGRREHARAVGRALLLQLAVREAPTNVKICVIADADGERDWGWAAWLPHCRWSPEEPFALVGSDRSSTKSRLEELRKLVQQRTDKQRADRKASSLPAIVVLLDDASRLLHAGFSEVLNDGPAVGVHFICLDENQVPEQCLASLTIPDDKLDEARLEQQRLQPVEDILIDAPRVPFCEVVARALAPLRALGDQGRAGDLPANLRLVDLLGVPDLTAETILARWQSSSPSASAIVGLTPDGPFDLLLTRDGPHGLVAGTTRSGKSEFLKTFVAAFALANHPDDLQFLFIDFKNSGDYRLASRLPHVIDLSTSDDLDVFERTLRLLEAEIDRRRKRFDEALATTIEGYRTARASHPELAPIGRIVVVADEFAQLVMKAPEQLDKLVTVAQTGAAFGVHLLLATQRPQGAVTGQIDANVALRICFRVEKPEESAAVIDAEDAGEIAQHHAGRAFARAHGEPLFELQSARVAGARPGSSAERKDLTVAVRLWTELGRVPSAKARVEVPDPETDLADIVDGIVGAARLCSWRNSAVPWPKPLPARVALADLPASDDDHLVPFAVVDEPASQARVAGGLRLGTGHLSVAGSGGTGRTTALRTLACSLALRRTAADAHLYVIDFSGGQLRPLADLPHCGGSAFDDWDQANRIVATLSRLVAARSELLSTAGHASIEHQRQSGEPPLPYLLLLIDGWHVIAEEGARYGLPDQLAQLLGKGQSVGLQAAVAGDRTVAAGRMGRLLASRYVLRFNDPNDYVTAGLSYRDILSAPQAGRAVIVGTAMEAQIAQLGAEGESEDAATKTVVGHVRRRDEPLRAKWPQRVQPLPKTLTLDELLAARPAPDTMAVPLLLGLSGETSQPVFVELGKSVAGAFVGGASGSGRTNALLAMAEVLIAHDVAIAVVSPNGSGLSRLAGRPGVTASMEGQAARKLDVAAIAKQARVILIDDAEQLDQTHPAHLSMVTGGTDISVVAAASTETLSGTSLGWLAALKRTRTGLIFSPRSKFDGALFGATLPEHMVFQGPTGRAVVGFAGKIDIVQVPKA